MREWIAQEVRQAVRRLAKGPSFSLAALLTLALAIGANTAIYSVVYGVVLNPLDYPQSERLMVIWHSAPGADISRINVSDGTFLYYRQMSRTLEELALVRSFQFILTGQGDPEWLTVAGVTSGFFDLLLPGGPALGRPITSADDQPEAARVALLSHGLWQRRFAGDAGILGRTIQVHGVEHEVIGVMPASFRFPSKETDLWVPMRIDPARTRLGGFNALAIGRLKPGLTRQDLQQDLNALIPHLSEPYPGVSYKIIVEQGRLTVHVTPLKENLVGSVQRMLWILFGTVGFVLLIACANVANLFMVRTEERRREMAVRTALGAGRARTVLHYFSESLLLGLMGGAVGLLLAWLGVRLLVRLGPESIPRLDEVGLSLPVLAFTALLSVFSGLTFGAVPLLRRRGWNLAVALKESGRGSTLGRERHRFRNLLATAQIGLALVLLIGAGLMARSFRHLSRLHPGFESQGVLTFQVSLPSQDYPNRQKAAAFQQRVIDRLSGLPGVESVGASSCLPLRDCSNVDPLYLKDAPLDPDVVPPAVEIRSVLPGYFQTMGIPLLAGRTIRRQDHENVSRAAWISKKLAQRFWPDQNPIGKQLYPDYPGQDPAWYTVVGLVGDVPGQSLLKEFPATLYLPTVGPYAPTAYLMSFVVKSSAPPLSLAKPAQDSIWELDPNLPASNVLSMRQIVSDAQAPMAFAMLLLGIAALTALALGIVGVYGVLSYLVSRRKLEIGLRMALGARSGQVGLMILRRAAGVAAAGVLLGLCGALALTRLMGTLLYQVQPTDLPTFTAASTTLFGVALLAAYFPARRAAKQDPVEALKSE